MSDHDAPSGDEAKANARGMSGTQTLTRGLDLISAVADGPLGLAELADQVGLSRTTTHRLACALAEQRYLKFVRGAGYSLGPRLLELGFLATRQSRLPRVARPHLEALASASKDTVYLGVLDGARALYLDKIPGSRGIEVSAGIGQRLPLRSTGLGKALIMDADEDALRDYYACEDRAGSDYNLDLASWLERMKRYASAGYALDLEENGDHIRCVAAPVRDATGAITGAISLASASQYMDETRLHGLAVVVKAAADAISLDLGYVPPPQGATPSGKRRRNGSRRAST
jgi:DNA-binding IclR family transcriptional regulator